MSSVRHSRWSASRHLQVVAGLLAFLVACPFTAPFRVCRTPDGASGRTHALHQPARPSDVAHLQANAVPVTTPPSVAEDPLKEEALISEGHGFTVTIAHESSVPLVAARRDVPRPVVIGSLRL